MDHGAQGMDHGAAGMSQPMTEGTVKKLDKSAGKLTIAHGPLENLGMPSMTMVFRAKDAAMLDQVKAGDKIRFTAERIGGAFTVIALEPAE
jgi:Cu/Ag efflux protein CusF